LTKYRLILLLNALSILVTIYINGLANALPINGMNTGQVSADYDNLFTPAGFTFSIWSIIYLGLIGFAIYQFSFWNKQNQLLSRINWKIIASGIFNCLWIFAWHYLLFELTLPLMIGLLVSLVLVNIDIYQYARDNEFNPKFTWLIRISFGIYLGWICVATIANISVFLTYINWGGFGLSPEFWLFVTLSAGVAVAVLLMKRLYAFTAAVAIAWGFYGIYQKLLSKDVNSMISYLVIAYILAIVSYFIWLISRRVKS
jgi:hypothetical protein